MKRNSDSSDHMTQEAAGERESTGKVMLFNSSLGAAYTVLGRMLRGNFTTDWHSMHRMVCAFLYHPGRLTQLVIGQDADR